MTAREQQDQIHDFDDLEPLELEPIEEDAETLLADIEPLHDDLGPLEAPPVPEAVPPIAIEVDPAPADFPAAATEVAPVLGEALVEGGALTVEENAVAPAMPAAGAPEPVGTPVAAPVQPGMIKSSSGGSRRERMEKEREARKNRPKKSNWVRWEGPGDKPKREMEKAPLILRKAACWLLIGSVLPWGGVGAAWTWVLVEKLLVAAGLYTWHQAHLFRDGGRAAGYVQKLGAKSFAPIFVVTAVLVLVGFSPILSWGDHTAFAEKGFLILAGLTFTHIYDYEVGGKFNPMFPLMFLAPGLGGLFALVKVFSESEAITVKEILAGLGAALVAIAGWMAAYTMYVALKEAKAHGEAKKAAALEARKAARATRSH